MQEVQIEGGQVFLKKTLTRKIQKKFNKIVFENAKMTPEGKPEVSLNKLDEANDIMVLGMIEKVIINNEEVVVNQEFLDELSQDDYQKILDKCTNIRKKSEDIKKK